MITLLQSIVDTIVSVGAFFLHTVQSLFQLIGRLPTFLSVLTTSIGFLPSVLVPFALITITVCAVKFIVGR